MASGIDNKINGYIFQWKIENISHYLWMENGEEIFSPAFIAESLNGTKWSLCFFCPIGDSDDFIEIYLHRENDCSRTDIIKVNFCITILDKDGLKTDEGIESIDFGKDFISEPPCRELKKRIFIYERETFLPEDTLTIQCTIWKASEEPVKWKHLYAKSIFNTNRNSLMWGIDKFSTRKFAIRKNFKNSSVDFNLILNAKLGFENQIVILTNSYNECIKYFSIKISIIDSEGKEEKCGMSEYSVYDLKKGVLSFMLDLPRKLMEDQNLYLPNDALCLHFEFAFTTETVHLISYRGGIIYDELENEDVKNKKEHCGIKEKLQKATGLTDDLQSMYNDGILSDVELCTSTKTFKAHMNILSARSPVFFRMFSHDMQEKKSGKVNITDLEDDTLHRMLLYMYTDFLENKLEIAYKLYVVADKYDILSLKIKCSLIMMENLFPAEACNVLILADQHLDDDLKKAVQDYILDHDEMFSSKEWIHFMDKNSKLAADIMHKKINLGKIPSCAV